MTSVPRDFVQRPEKVSTDVTVIKMLDADQAKFKVIRVGSDFS